MALRLQRQLAIGSQQRPALRRQVVVRASSARQEGEDSQARRPVLMALLGLASGGLLAAEPARADEGADRRAAERARRKAILAASRAKAEASLTATKNTAEIDAETERKNEERRRLAAGRASAIQGVAAKEYSEAAARAVQTPPPI